MHTWRWAAGILAAILATGGVCAAADKSVNFTDEKFFRFGMELSAANAAIGEDELFEIGYRIDTPQTNELACRYNKQVVYLLRFYQGRCYHFEKRADVAAEQVQAIFTYFHERFGDTPEATQSKQGELYFSRWSLRDREIELTAYVRQGGSYAVIYQEVDGETEGEALRARDSELQSQPSEVDPITGKPRPSTQPPPDNGEEQAAPPEDADQPGQGEAKPEPKPGDKPPDDQPPPDDDDDEPGEDW